MSGPATRHHAGVSKAQVYRPRRPVATLLHRVVRENLDSYLVSGVREDHFAPNIPFHVQTAFRDYLKCGIPAHGFARVYCAGCGHDFDPFLGTPFGSASGASDETGLARSFLQKAA